MPSSDPTYIQYRPNGYPIWRAPKRYVDMGYEPKWVPLEKGHRDDGRHKERVVVARDLTAAMLRWADEKEAATPAPETVRWLIERYKTDEGSAYHTVKANTRRDYDTHLNYWAAAIGDTLIRNITFEFVTSLEAGMKKNGRSIDFIHRKFERLRAIIKHGVLIRATGAKDVRETLSLMTFKMPAKRDVAPSRIQVYRVVVKALRAGYASFATGILLQYELALRAVDVRGQWLPADGEGGIVNNGRRWTDGLTWEMVDDDLSGFTKVISKTKDSLPDPIRFDLRNLPRIRTLLDALAAPESRVGPVILSSAGLPYDKRTWAALWRRFAREGQVPDHIRAMDLRAGAISEADSLGASREVLSQAAQHSDIHTTGRYVRGRSKAVAQVIDMRQRRKG